MLIIASLYVGAAWLLFFRFKLLPWNWPWRIVTVLMGCFILAVFLALLNTLTPSGRIVVGGRVVEVTPNVAGTVTSIPIQPNVLVKAGSVLFQIDPAPYEAKVRQLDAAVAEARQKFGVREATTRPVNEGNALPPPDLDLLRSATFTLTTRNEGERIGRPPDEKGSEVIDPAPPSASPK